MKFEHIIENDIAVFSIFTEKKLIGTEPPPFAKTLYDKKRTLKPPWTFHKLIFPFAMSIFSCSVFSIVEKMRLAYSKPLLLYFQFTLSLSEQISPKV